MSDNYIITPKAFALVGYTIYLAKRRGITDDKGIIESNIMNEVLKVLSDEMVAEWVRQCNEKGITGLKSDEAIELFHLIYETSNR